jgi:hypothetical protein
VRPGLALAGSVLLVLALAALVLVTLSPPGAREVQRVWTVPTGTLPASGSENALLQGTNSSSAVVTVTWSATVPTSVRIYSAPGCRSAAGCTLSSPIRSWTSGLSGNWTFAGALILPYVVIWNTSSATSGTFGLTAVASVSTPIPAPVWQTVIVDGAGIALAVIGAVALFLGLFLRGGAFRGPAPLVSRSADDAEDIARAPRGPN